MRTDPLADCISSAEAGLKQAKIDSFEDLDKQQKTTQKTTGSQRHTAIDKVDVAVIWLGGP